MITVTNEMTSASLDYTSGAYKVSGDFKVSPSGQVNSVNLSITKSSNMVGNANAYLEGGSLKYSYNRINKEDAGAVTNIIDTIVSELETKYKPTTK